MDNSISHLNMIKQQLRTGHVIEEKILSLFSEFPRTHFVPENMQPFAYSDLQIPLAHEERMMTPLEEATILQQLELKGHETVLEIGTGTGYLTAMLSRLCQKVISIDCYPDFTAQARKNLNHFQCRNVELFTGDASAGWASLAPYDVIIFTGAIQSLKKIHELQVLPGGQLFAPIGEQPAIQGRLYQLSHEGQWQNKILFETTLPYLVNAESKNSFIF
jgi:protein-L-isoaspartate(D-aspartate) O-methyltransferase